MRRYFNPGKAMKRIGRYILNGLTVLSLLLCVATVGLWMLSDSASPSFAFIRHNENCVATLSGGDITIANSPDMAWEELRVLIGPRTSRLDDSDSDFARRFKELRAMATAPPWSIQIRFA